MNARLPVLALNGIGLWGLSAVLVAAVAIQLVSGELPCPLSLLQRIAMAAVGFGLLLNVRFGPKPAHYGLVILAALYGLAAATRQVFLHIAPGSGAYGSPLLGLHLYTWCAIIFLAAILVCALLLLWEGQFEEDGPVPTPAPRWVQLGAVALMAVTAVVAVLAFAECGPTECADDPTGYWLFGGGT